MSVLSLRNFRSLVAVVIGEVRCSCVGCVVDIVNMVYARYTALN